MGEERLLAVRPDNEKYTHTHAGNWQNRDTQHTVPKLTHLKESVR